LGFGHGGLGIGDILALIYLLLSIQIKTGSKHLIHLQIIFGQSILSFSSELLPEFLSLFRFQFCWRIMFLRILAANTELFCDLSIFNIIVLPREQITDQQ
jgi:hypothetical protein